MSPLGIFHHYSKFDAVDEKIDTKYHIFQNVKLCLLILK